MNSERWQQIEKLFEAVLERKPDEREEFINEACADDEELRQELESLLQAHSDSQSFMEQPAVREVAEVVLGSGKKLSKGQTVGHYKILSELGKGGQGAVYKALDTKLQRTLALKTLPPELIVDETAYKRFQREAQLASSLDHPNICTVHDLTKFDGTHLIVMQFVAGKNVRELVNGRPLELKCALKVAIQVCDALAAAHAQGIIHRDIKAHNIIITDKGQAKILDFGLAKLTQENSSGKEQTEITALGSPYGTPSYAAPEQSRGERVDHRADIFSTGVLLYEMLTGTWAFHGKTAVDVRHAVLHDQPKPIAERRGEIIPEKLQTIIDKALAKEPAKRYQQIAEMRDDLIAVLRELPEGETSETANFLENFKTYAPRRIGTLSKQAKLLFAAASVLIIAFTGFLIYRFVLAPQTGAQQSVIESIVVLPFVNETGNAETEYLSDGLTESLINKFSQLPQLKVIARSSSFRYKGKEIDPVEVAQTLKVQALITGTVVQRGDNLVMNVELINGSDGTQIWGSQYSRKLSDIQAMQEDVTRAVSDNLRLRLTGEEQKSLTKRYTENTEAYQLYLKGNYYWNKFTPEAERTAIDYYTQASAKDPNFALPYAGIVHGYQVSANNGWMRPNDSYPKAKAATAKGLELDPNNPSLLTAFASNAMFYDWDWAAAERGFKRANEIEPNYWHHHELYAYLLTAQGRIDEAIAEAKRSQEIDPLSLIGHVSASHPFYFSRQYDRSIEQAQKTLELDPGFPFGHLMLARNFVQQGKYEDAIAKYNQAISLMGRTSQILGELGQVHAMSGKRAEVLTLLTELKEMSANRYVSPLDFAYIYTGLGDKQQAIDYLEKAHQERSTWLMWIKVDPRFDSLREEPRFQDLLRRMNLS